MKKILKNTKKTKAYLASLPKIYTVACFARYGVREYPFTEKYFSENGFSIPLVYEYNDFNGTQDIYLLRKLDMTSGAVIMWTQNKAVADKVAELFNKELKEKWNTRD